MNELIIFGAKYLVFLMLIIAAIAFVFLRRENKKKAIIFSAFVLPLSFIVARILSFFFYNPRPFVSEKITPLIAHAADNGFPSDHTLLASAVAAVVFSFDKKIGITLWILAIVVGTSRVLVGVHHTEDIVGSIVIVLLMALLAGKFLMPRVVGK